MKVLKARHKLLFWTVVLTQIAAFILVSRFLNSTVNFSRIYNLSFLPVIFILFSPWGSIVLKTPHDKPHKKFGVWLFQIIALEVSLLIIYWGISVLIGSQLPVFSENHFSLASTSLKMITLSIPWIPMALIASILGYLSYNQRKDAYFSSIVNFLIPSSPQTALGALINGGARSATLFAFCTTVALVALFTASILTESVRAISGMTVNGIIVALILLFLAFNKFTRQKIENLILKYSMSARSALLFILALLVVSLVLLSNFFSDTESVKLKIPHFLQVLNQQGFKTHWYQFSLLWWLAWTPITAIFIARLSQGRSIRSVILGMCIPMTILYCYLYGWSPVVHIAPWMCVMITWFGLLTLFAIVLNEGSLGSILQTYLPTTDAKHRSSYRFILKIFQLSILVTALYLFSGVVFLNVIFFGFMLTFCVFLLVLPFIFLRAFFIKKNK